jgi:hypothetical protein
MDTLSNIGTAAATASAPRPTPEISARTAQDDDKANEVPAFAKNETQATPPPKKGLGVALDIFA